MTRTADPFDELASVFLTESDDPVPTARGAAVEMLLVGHLPVRGALWLAPYADAVARQAGPTALVRLDRDEPMISVLRGSGDEAESRELASCRNLREAILHLGDSIRAWIVRPSSRSAVEEVVRASPPTGAASSADVERITILSSANEVAVASAYQLMKHLAEAAEAGERELPGIGVAVIGSGPDAAEAMVRRLHATTRTHLDRDVTLVLTLPRIDSAIRESGLRTFPGQGRPALDEVVAWIGEARRRATPPAAEGAPTTPAADVVTTAPPSLPPNPPTQTPPNTPSNTPPRAPGPPMAPGPPRVVVSPAVAAKPRAVASADDLAAGFRRSATPPAAAPAPATPLAEEIASPDIAPDPAADPAADVADPAEPARSAPPPPPPIRIPPKAAIDVEPKQPVPPAEPDEQGRPLPLACHVADPAARPPADATAPATLRPITPRCPGHERVELAVDAHGRIHLLGREETLREMPVVERWAWAHRELLAMACPEVSIDPAGPTVCHLFAEEPARLADLHGSAIHLHVLTPVDVDGRRGWYAAPLNRPA